MPSHIHYFGLCILGVPNFNPLERPAEVQREAGFVRFDGRWRRVSLTTPFDVSGQLLTAKNSTGACSIVRTVLNYQSIPHDKTCKYNRVETHAAANDIARWRHDQFVLETV